MPMSTMYGAVKEELDRVHRSLYAFGYALLESSSPFMCEPCCDCNSSGFCCRDMSLFFTTILFANLHNLNSDMCHLAIASIIAVILYESHPSRLAFNIHGHLLKDDSLGTLHTDLANGQTYLKCFNNS